MITLDNNRNFIEELTDESKFKQATELLTELKAYFDEDELSKSQIEFEALIFGRIKMGIHVKSIRVLL